LKLAICWFSVRKTMEQTDTIRLLSRQASVWGRLATTAVAHMTEHLYVGIITVVLPVMATALGLSMAQAGLLVSARSLVAGLSNMPSGLLADMINRRSLLLGLSLVVIGLSSFLMSFAPDFWTLLLLMAFGAVGAGSFHPQSLAILSASYRDRRALVLGVHDSSGSLAKSLAARCGAMSLPTGPFWECCSFQSSAQWGRPL